MLWTPPALPQRSLNLPSNAGSSSAATTVTAGASGVEGSWASIIDPVPFDVTLIGVAFSNTNVSATQTDMVVDIGVGPAGGGSEQVLIPDLLAGWVQGSMFSRMIFLPVNIAQGSRISARARALIASDTVDVNIVLFGGGPNLGLPGFAGCDVYGISGQQGTSHTPGASGVESSWANIGGTTSRHYDAVFPLVQGNLADTTMLAEGVLWEVGWSSGSPIVGRWAWFGGTSESSSMMWPPLPVCIPIPSGTQLQVRAESSIAAPEAHDVALYCLYT